MGTSRQDIFGEGTGAQPATPGSYGQPPAGFRLPESLNLGPVRLQVADLERSLTYYQQTLGLRLLDRQGGGAALGAAGAQAPLVELRERKGVRPARSRGQTGLFHFAIVLPDRPALGRFVRHLGQIGARAGAGDHLVSEAFYLQDPDNLGIEIYADRPMSSWRRIGRELMMATDPVDVPAVVAAAGQETWDGMPSGTRMGHVHLHVGDISAAAAFYSEGLGFDRTVWDYPGALFMSAGGYHHHLGVNTWAGSGATAPTESDAQLLEWTIELGQEGDVLAAAASLQRAGFGVAPEGTGGFTVSDPWDTRLRIRTATPR